MKPYLCLLALVSAGAIARARQPAAPNPRQPAGATVMMYAPEQHDLYDGHFVISAGGVYMAGGLNDPVGCDGRDLEVGPCAYPRLHSRPA